MGFWCAGQGLFLGLSIRYMGELICNSLTSCVLMILCFSVMFVMAQDFLKKMVAIEGKDGLTLTAIFFTVPGWC